MTQTCDRIHAGLSLPHTSGPCRYGLTEQRGHSQNSSSCQSQINNSHVAGHITSKTRTSDRERIFGSGPISLRTRPFTPKKKPKKSVVTNLLTGEPILPAQTVNQYLASDFSDPEIPRHHHVIMRSPGGPSGVHTGTMI
jgi:hypothetical protein